MPPEDGEPLPPDAEPPGFEPDVPDAPDDPDADCDPLLPDCDPLVPDCAPLWPEDDCDPEPLDEPLWEEEDDPEPDGEGMGMPPLEPGDEGIGIGMPPGFEPEDGIVGCEKQPASARTPAPRRPVLIVREMLLIRRAPTPGPAPFTRCLDAGPLTLVSPINLNLRGLAGGIVRLAYRPACRRRSAAAVARASGH